MIKSFIILLLLIAGVSTSFGQSITWEDFADQYFSDEEEGGGEGLTLYDELLEMHRNPVNINLAQKSDLLLLPFISEAQADSILSLVRRSYGLLSLGELQFVQNLERKELSYLPLFFFCERTAAPDSLRTEKPASSYWDMPEKKVVSEISTTLGIPLYKREGFKSHSAQVLEKNPNKQYLGNNLSTTLRYRSSYANRLFWGLTAQKDEGEPFASKDNTLYDSYAFYLMGKGSGILRQWIVGDYRAQFGLGLTMGSASPDAMNLLSSYSPRQQGFVRHTSTDEATFLRGGAITLKMRSLALHAFASWRKLDATLASDSISTIKTDGYHRTPLEMSKRNNIQALQGGLSAVFSLQAFNLGLQVTHTHYDTPYRTPTALYRKYYFQGQDFGNYSLYYSYSHQALRLWGETATSLQGGIATQHRLQYAPSYALKFLALHRYYTTRYLATSAQSYKVGSRIQNEHGLLLGLNWSPAQMWFLKFYADYTRYPFAVYATDHPSSAITLAAQAEYTPLETTSFLVRYKYRQRPKDNKQDQLDRTQQHTLKLQARYTTGPVAMTTAADITLLSQPDKSNTSGWMLSHKATLSASQSTRISMAAALFHTDSYSEALRLYEPSLLYSTGFPSCYYHGQRLSAALIQKIGPLQLAIKYSLTHYTNRQSIGSDLRLYNGTTPQDIIIQGMLNF